MDAVGTPYVIVGGFAVSVWGNPRTTEDVDAIVQYTRDDIASLVEALAARSLQVDSDDLRDSLEDGSHATVFAGATGYRVDVIPSTRPDRQRQIEEARPVELLGRKVPVSSAEATIAYKLRFGSAQDVRDAEAIYARRREQLDVPHLGRLCATLDVTVRLESLIRRVDAALDRDAN